MSVLTNKYTLWHAFLGRMACVFSTACCRSLVCSLHRIIAGSSEIPRGRRWKLFRRRLLRDPFFSFCRRICFGLQGLGKKCTDRTRGTVSSIQMRKIKSQAVFLGLWPRAFGTAIRSIFGSNCDVEALQSVLELYEERNISRRPTHIERSSQFQIAVLDRFLPRPSALPGRLAMSFYTIF